MWLKLILLSLVSLPAWGYRLTQDFYNNGDGFYWQSLPIDIMVVEKDAGRKAMLESIANDAIQKWESNSGYSLWSFTGSGTKNIIRWSTNFAKETKMDPASVLAVAIRYVNGPYFAKTEIVINGGHSLNQIEKYLRTTLTHELGHTMGLDHSENGNAIMAPTLQEVGNINFDDVQGMSHAHSIHMQRQAERYVSPLAYSTEETQSQPLSCGTVGPVAQASAPSMNGLLSLAGGLLISFVRKVLVWFKSRL